MKKKGRKNETTKEILEALLGPDEQAPELLPISEIGLLQTPNAAVQLALADLLGLQLAAEAQGLILDTSVFRYIWIPDASVEDHGLVSFVLNSVISRSDINYAPDTAVGPIQVVANGTLIRMNLQGLCPLNQGKDLTE
ncbi:MAG: hypothetical protein IH951_13100, partial [Bacteroidetes bacterium]|nr:hypothetical protein [Bacteroidota bacterium]